MPLEKLTKKVNSHHEHGIQTLTALLKILKISPLLFVVLKKSCRFEQKIIHVTDYRCLKS
jgi:hypothetical protein